MHACPVANHYLRRCKKQLGWNHSKLYARGRGLMRIRVKCFSLRDSQDLRLRLWSVHRAPHQRGAEPIALCADGQLFLCICSKCQSCIVTSRFMYAQKHRILHTDDRYIREPTPDSLLNGGTLFASLKTGSPMWTLAFISKTYH
jgi:hypothetical protein